MKNVFKVFLMMFASGLVLTSCSNDDDDNDNIPNGEYDNGVLVLNEGGFGYSNASVSFINSANELENNIYTTVNTSGLGDVAQSIGFEDNKAYIVVNNSSTIEVVNRYTFTHLATITDQISNPRYIVFEDDKAYVSNWGDPADATDDYIAVINTNTNIVETTIAVGEGPEALVEEDGKLFVAQKGGWNSGNTVTVINLATNEVTATIDVADIPDTMDEEDGYLYVLSSGFSDWTGNGGDTTGAITKINISDNAVVETLTFETGIHPSNLKIEDDQIYYTSGKAVYSKSLSGALPSSPLFTAEDATGIYGFEVEDNKIYIADAKDYTSTGSVFIYSLTGTLEHSYDVGIVPNGFYFND